MEWAKDFIGPLNTPLFDEFCIDVAILGKFAEQNKKNMVSSCRKKTVPIFSFFALKNNTG